MGGSGLADTGTTSDTPRSLNVFGSSFDRTSNIGETTSNVGASSAGGSTEDSNLQGLAFFQRLGFMGALEQKAQTWVRERKDERNTLAGEYILQAIKDGYPGKPDDLEAEAMGFAIRTLQRRKEFLEEMRDPEKSLAGKMRKAEGKPADEHDEMIASA